MTKKKQQRRWKQRRLDEARRAIAPAPAVPTPAPRPAPAKSATRPQARKIPTGWVPAQLTRGDLVAAVSIALAAGTLFLTRLTDHPGLGDAPESVAGIASLGVLHAPGYPAYVLAAKVFTVVEPFGSLALRVTLFSLLCASLTCALAYLLGRRVGGSRAGAAIAASALATGGGFWFYADFAKHDAFSGLLMILAVYLLVDFSGRPTSLGLVSLAAVLGIESGSAWSLGATLLPAVLFALIYTRRRWRLSALVAAIAVGIVVTAALYGFVLLRARADPALNWGATVNLQRLVDLVTLKDFQTGGPTAAPGGAGPLGKLPQRFAGVVLVLVRQLGPVACLLGAWGAWLAWRRRSGWAAIIAIALAVDLVAAGRVMRVEHIQAVEADILAEGALYGSLFGAVTLVASGATDVLVRLRTALVDERGVAPSRLPGAAAATLAVVVIAPAILLNQSVPAIETAPRADQYASAVLNELPPRAVVFVWHLERADAILYRQVVLRDRPDISVVAGDALVATWYREQASRRLGVAIPQSGLSLAQLSNSIVSASRQLQRRGRKVYLELPTAQAMRKYLGYRPVGLVAELVPGTKHGFVGASPNLGAELTSVLRSAGVPDPAYALFPNTPVRDLYSSALIELADDQGRKGDYAAAEKTIRTLLQMDSGNVQARDFLRQLSKLPFR